MRQPIAALAFLLASGLFSTFGSAAPHGLVLNDDRPNNQPPSIGTTDQPIIELDPSPNLQVINSNQWGVHGPIRAHSQEIKSVKKRGGIFGSIVESIIGSVANVAEFKGPLDLGIKPPIKPIPRYFLPRNITEIWDPGPNTVKRQFAQRARLAEKLVHEYNSLHEQTGPKPTDGNSKGPTRGPDKGKGPADAANHRPKPAGAEIAEQAQQLAAKPMKTQADIARGRVLANAVKNKKIC